MKNKKTNPEKAKALQSILSNALLIAKDDGNREPIEQDIINASKKEIKMAQQSKDSGAPYNKLTFDVANEFLPKTMSEEELTLLIRDIISHDSNSNIGTVMKVLKTQHANRYDGKMASGIVKKLI